MRRRPGFVYLITNPAWPGFVKAGAAKTLKGRLADFQTATPHRDFRVATAITFNDRFAAEGVFKRQMRGFRIKGTEWFHLHAADARAALLKIQEQNY